MKPGSLYVPPSSGGGGGIGGFPKVVAVANYTAQSGSLNFNLLDSPVTGDYVLNDYLTIVAADSTARLELALNYADNQGAESLIIGNLSFSVTGAISLQAAIITGALGNSFPTLLHALTGTPIAVAITVTPSTVATASPTSGNLGLLYAPGDTGLITSGDGTAAYTVLTVGVGGAVETVQITNGGGTYLVSTGNATSVITGNGDGTLELDILTLSTTLQYDYNSTLVRNQ